MGAQQPATAIDEACGDIYRRWLRFVPEDQALAEAERFRRRFNTLAAEGRLTEAELDATMELVGEAIR